MHPEKVTARRGQVHLDLNSKLPSRADVSRENTKPSVNSAGASVEFEKDRGEHFHRTKR